MRTKTRATQVTKYDQRKGTKKTPRASRCIMAKGVTPIREMRAPFGRGIDRDRAAEAMRRIPLPDFRGSVAIWAPGLSVLRARTSRSSALRISLLSVRVRVVGVKRNCGTGRVRDAPYCWTDGLGVFLHGLKPIGCMALCRS